MRTTTGENLVSISQITFEIFEIEYFVFSIPSPYHMKMLLKNYFYMLWGRNWKEKIFNFDFLKSD